MPFAILEILSPGLILFHKSDSKNRPDRINVIPQVIK